MTLEPTCHLCGAPTPEVGVEDPGPVCRGCVRSIRRLLAQGEVAALREIWALPERFDPAALRGTDLGAFPVPFDELVLRQAVWRSDASLVLRLAREALEASDDDVDSAEIVEALLAPSVLNFGGLSALRKQLVRI